jgi:hypothetical protein
MADPHNLNNTTLLATHKQKGKKDNHPCRNQSTNILESYIIIHPNFLGTLFSTTSLGVHTNLNKDTKKTSY